MKKITIILLAIVSLFYGCHKNVVTGKSSLSLVPETELIGMSLTEYDKFLSEHPPLPASDERVVLVRRCGQRIQKAVEEFYASKNASDDLKGFAWEFNVVNENVVNAWCMPGGKVVVYTGLLPVTQDEASLAIVMGHEIGHAVARHGNERMSQAMVIQGIGTGLSIALSQKPELTQQIFAQAYGITTGLAALKYSRNDESEADHMGLIFAAMAGYNPETAITFWQRMAAASEGSQKPPELLSTHPSDETRINNLKKLMPEAMKYYKPR
jgi:predicted Zn-dependent protease